MSKKLKKILSLVAICAIVATMGMGAFSYFTDYATDNVTANAGTLAIKLTDVTEDLTGGLKIMNPGDTSDFKFKVSNDAEKSADVFAVVTVTGTPVGTATTASPYKLVDNNGDEVTTKETDGNAYSYTLPVQALIGSLEKDSTLDGTISEFTYDYGVTMDLAALNEWQDSTVDVVVEIYAKQHRNTSDITSKIAEWKSYVEEDNQ